MPSCTSCTKGQVQCQYPSKWHDRQLRQEYIKSVERRLRELENENARLRGRDAGPDDTPMADTPQADTPQADNAAGITEAEQEAAMIMALAAAGTDFGGQPQPQPPAAGRPATTVIAVTISTAISVAVTNSYTPFVTDATAAPISSGIAVFPTISASTPDLSSATTTTATTVASLFGVPAFAYTVQLVAPHARRRGPVFGLQQRRRVYGCCRAGHRWIISRRRQ